MADIVFKSGNLKQASEFLVEALKSEKSRILHCLQLAEERLRRYEKKYNVPSEKFMGGSGLRKTLKAKILNTLNGRER